ncbi:MAG: energy transducer TonB [Spirochaetia bacterium]|nr:energy transducer TonB [Spirochaetia bacterium]
MRGLLLKIKKSDIPNLIRLASVVIVCVVYVLLFRFVKSSPKLENYAQTEFDATMFKLVDVMEYAPPPPAPEEKVIVMTQQTKAAEKIIETEEKIQEIPDTTMAGDQEIDFLPQHKISSIPVIPTETILKRVEYPAMALQQGIEGVVYLELYIDQYGTIRKAVVLRDPGHGFAQAALKALEGLSCIPATANGQNVAVRFRYPVRFAIR